MNSITFTQSTPLAPLDTRDRRVRIVSFIAFFFALACLLAIIGALLTSVRLSPAFETMRATRSVEATVALRKELNTLHWLSVVCAQIGLILGIRTYRTWAGRFSVYATGIPLTLIVLLKTVTLLFHFLMGH